MKKAVDIYSDRNTVIRLRKGDEHAFTVLYDRYVSMVYNYVSSILKDAILAKDITQFCFMQIAEALDISPKTVETQLSRSLSAIRKRISKIMALSLVLGAAFRF